MHELEHIITKSVLFRHLADGKVEMEGGAVLMARRTQANTC